MRLRGLLFVALASCYEPPRTDEACTITCTEGASDNCPADLACENGYCVSPGQVCRPTFVALAAGTGFACAIDDAAALWCWGSINGAMLATRYDATRSWELVDAGGGHVCGIAGGRLYCWGENNDREVSGSIVGDVGEPFEIIADGVATWSAVSAGRDATCAIGDGKLFCWGDNTFGQLGDGTTMPRGLPTPATTALADWTAVSVGSAHACAVSMGSGVHCSGRNLRGELGPGVAVGTSSATPLPVTRQGVALAAVDIAVGSQSSCAITPERELYCWGSHASGQLGDKRLVDWATIAQSSEPLLGSDVPGWSKLDGSHVYMCGLAGDAVYCWGEADAGGLGNGYWADTRSFTKVIAANATELSLGWNYNVLSARHDLDLACAVVGPNMEPGGPAPTGGSDVQCWGDNRYGQLSRGDATLAPPTELDSERTWVDVSAGLHHMCGIADDLTVYCWGSTVNGQTTGFVYGGGTPRTACANNPSEPTQPLCDIGAPRALGYAPDPKALATGTAHTCALSNGVVSCWGSGLPGGALERDISQPGGAMWKTLLPSGRDGQCGIADNQMSHTYCFGSVLTSTAMPARVPMLDGFTAIGLGGPPGYGVFLGPAGQLHGIGDNSRYQLGDGTMTPYASLTPVGTRTYSAITTRASDSATRGDANFVCGIRSTDQRVECWGMASRGQTGAAVTATPTTTPNEVMGLASCTAIAAGVEHACAICDGAIWCWGDNRTGQLAAPPSDEVSSVPRLVDIVLADDPWQQLVAGARFTCARSAAGHVYCWGFDEHGAIGNGATGANLPMTIRASQID